MAKYGDPESAIISIWHREVGSGGRFLGSGAFISPRFVITAKHFVEVKSQDELCLGLVEGEHSVPVEKIHCHQGCDIALIELEKPFEKQTLVQCDFRRDDLKGKQATLYGVHPESKGRAKSSIYTFGSWMTAGLYTIDFRQHKGFSGGVAVVGDHAIGVISQRHKDAQEGLIIALYLAGEWLREIVGDEEAKRYFPPDPADIQLYSKQPQSKFTQQVRQEISRLLRRRKLYALGVALVESFAENDRRVKPENLLVPFQEEFSIEESIDCLHIATENCLRQIVDDNKDNLQDIKSGARDLLGWLILLAVSESWLEDKPELSERLFSTECIEIPVETKAGAEVVMARWNKRAAKLDLANDGFEVFNPDGLFSDDWDDLELGIDTADQLSQIQQLIWTTVMKSKPPLPFDSKAQGELRYTLATRYRRGESFYIIISPNYEGPVATGSGLLSRLRSELPHIGVFLIGSPKDDQVFVMPEPHFHVLAREFFIMLGKYP